MESPIIGVLRRGYEEFSENQGAGAQDGLAPDFEVIDHILPEGAPSVRGPEALRANFELVREAFGELRYEPEEFLERHGKILVRVHGTGTARHTGIPLDLIIGHIWTFGERGAKRLEILRSWEETLAAAGREEEPGRDG